MNQQQAKETATYFDDRLNDLQNRLERIEDTADNTLSKCADIDNLADDMREVKDMLRRVLRLHKIEGGSE